MRAPAFIAAVTVAACAASPRPQTMHAANETSWRSDGLRQASAELGCAPQQVTFEFETAAQDAVVVYACALRAEYRRLPDGTWKMHGEAADI